MKVLTSFTVNRAGEGEQLSYTYSEVDAASGAVLRQNVRESLLVLDLPANAEVLTHMKALRAYLGARLEG